MTKHKENDNEKFEDEIETEEAQPAENSENQQSAEDEVKQLQEENQKLKDSFLRAYAEAENTKKRCAQEIEKNSKYAISSFAKELLVVADNLSRALDAADENLRKNCEAMIKGVELTQNELTKVFNKFGIKRIESMGKVFNPNFEQVVQEAESDELAGTVISVLQSGYMINDRILREAMVIVSKGKK